MKWSEEQVSKLRELCHQGVSNKEIAAKIGCSLKEIYSKRSRLGITIAKCATTPNKPDNDKPKNEDSNKVKGYKGFDKDLKCRGFQYEIDGEYEEPDAVICKKGFHFCEYPLDVFGYYPPAGSRYCEVEAEGDMAHNSKDSKVATTKIHIGAELGIKGLIDAAIKFVFDKADWSKKENHATGNYGAASATGNYGAASATGDYGAASATGNYGAASATGYQGAASATGNYGAASATGDYGAASATGDRGAASATGDRGAASATGDRGAASATGYRGAASATGYRGAASATGDYGAASATGYQGAASATGYQGAASATGNYGAASATGDYGAASATGDYGAASATGKEGIAVSLGIESKAKGALGCWLVLAKWEIQDDGWHRTNVKCGLVDGDTIKPDTYYTLLDGKFVELKDD